MEVSYSSILAAMDSLWFQRIILLAEPISAIYSKTIAPSSDAAEASHHSEEDGVSTDSFSSSSTLNSQDDYRIESEEEKPVQRKNSRNRPTRLNLVGNKSRSQSSSPSVNRPRKSLSDTDNTLHRFLSCKTLRELEQVELKGFVDLGFQFEKEKLSPRTVNIIPGLQRLRQQETDVNENLATIVLPNGKEEDATEKDKRVVATPYLSDAWMVKKPGSPLLRLRMARVSTAQDMKNCLKLWARTVASSIQT